MSKIQGLVVATVTPYHADGSIDWASFDRMIDHISGERGVTGIFVNGHAGDASLLNAEERRQVIARAKDRLLDHQTLFAGAVSMSTHGVCEEARMAEDLGADVVVPFPAPAMAQGAMASDAVPMAFFEKVTASTKLPLSIFQMPLGSGLGMKTDGLVKLVKNFPIVAIKEGSDTIVAYEDNFYAIRDANPDVAILPSSYDFFLAQLAVGADGILSGLGSLAPRLLAKLWNDSVSGDLDAMRETSRELYPLIRAIYGSKVRMHMHTRIKAGLMSMGIIENYLPRGPLIGLSEAELEEIQGIVSQYSAGTL